MAKANTDSWLEHAEQLVKETGKKHVEYKRRHNGFSSPWLFEQHMKAVRARNAKVIRLMPEKTAIQTQINF
jgi:hypothetical protein